jgi:hypothetical protein
VNILTGEEGERVRAVDGSKGASGGGQCHPERSEGPSRAPATGRSSGGAVPSRPRRAPDPAGEGALSRLGADAKTGGSLHAIFEVGQGQSQRPLEIVTRDRHDRKQLEQICNDRGSDRVAALLVHDVVDRRDRMPRNVPLGPALLDRVQERRRVRRSRPAAEHHFEHHVGIDEEPDHFAPYLRERCFR